MDGRNSDRDDIVNAPGDGGSYSRSVPTAASNSNPKISPRPHQEAEVLRNRVQQLEQQLKIILDTKKADAEVAPRTKSTQLLRKNSDPSSAPKYLYEGTWEGDGPQSAEYLVAQPPDPSGTRAMLAKSRYLGSSHWMHGIALVSQFLFRFFWK